MGTAVGSDRRWRLPARRRRVLTIAVPAVGTVTAAGCLLLGQGLEAVALALTLAGLLWTVGVALVRLTDTPSPPGSRTLHPDRAERRHLLRTVRRRVRLDESEAAELRPLVVQTGLSSARAAVLGPALMLTIAGYAFRPQAGWWLASSAAGFLLLGVTTAFALRDRQACAEFLDRY